MNRFSASVGKGKTNKPSDVALLQLIGKILKNSSNKSYYSGDIDGKDASGAVAAMLEIVEKKNLAGFYGLYDSVSIRNGNKLFALLPQQYQKYGFHFISSFKGRMIAEDLKGSGTKKPTYSYTVKDLPLPNKEAEQLLWLLNRVGSRFKIVLSIEKIGVLASTRFFVRLSASGGTWIDLKTGKFATAKALDEAEVADFLLNNSKSRQFQYLNSPIWSLVSHRRLVFKTSRTFEILKISNFTQSTTAFRLGFRSKASKESSEVALKCYAAYEEARLYGELDKDKEEFFFQCFGKDLNSVLQNQEVRKSICMQWLRTLKSVTSEEQNAVGLVASYKRELEPLYQKKAEATGTRASKAGIEVLTLVLSHLKILGKFIDSALEAYSKGPEKWHGKASDVIKEGLIGAGEVGAQEAIGTLDRVDVALVVLGLAGTVLGAAPLVVITTAASVVKTAYEVWVYDDEIDEDIKDKLTKLGETLNNLVVIRENIEIILKAMAAENCFTSLADYGYTLER